MGETYVSETLVSYLNLGCLSRGSSISMSINAWDDGHCAKVNNHT